MRLGAGGRWEHGVGIDAEAVVGEALPITQVVARLVAGAGEVGDFILRDAGGVEALGGSLVECDGEGLVGDMVGVVAGATGDEFASQAGVGVHLQHVDADVREFEREGLVERLLPAFGGLVGQAGDEVDADFGDAGVAQAADVVEGDGAAVQAPDGAGFLIDEGLDSERDAIDAGAEQRGQDFGGERAGSDFDGDFGVGRKLKDRGYGGKEAVELIGGEDAGRASAEIDGVEERIEGRAGRCAAAELRAAWRFAVPGGRCSGQRDRGRRHRRQSCRRNTWSGRRGRKDRARNGRRRSRGGACWLSVAPALIRLNPRTGAGSI